MPLMSGLNAAQTILSAAPPASIIILTNHDQPQILAEAKRIGARGMAGYKDWSREIATQAGSAVRLATIFEKAN